MNIHEYQAKQILQEYSVPVPYFKISENLDEIEAIAKEIKEKTKTNYWIIKAQIHAGGRGKGGGVKLAKSIEEVKTHSKNILGMQLITKQTASEGKKVNKILIGEDIYYSGESDIKEFYISILLNRKTNRNMILYSTAGGIDIEEVSEKTPELIFSEEINPSLGLQAFQTRKIASNLNLKDKAFDEMVNFIKCLYNAYRGSDASLIEINPTVKTADNKIYAADTKMVLENNAFFRHLKHKDLIDITEEDPSELEANKYGLNYVKLEGNVGCMVNGAGLAMATMDIIKLSGGTPANFLDVGGKANADTVEKGFRLILNDKNVKAIFINIFGGIVRCDRVAEGIVQAYKNIENINIPLVVRLQGTNAIEAKKIIDDSKLKIKYATDFQEAADIVKYLLN